MPHRIRDGLQSPEPREDLGAGVGKGSGTLTAWKLGPEPRGRAEAPVLPGWKRRPDQGQALHLAETGRGAVPSPGQSPLCHSLSLTNFAIICPSEFSVTFFTTLAHQVTGGRLLKISERGFLSKQLMRGEFNIPASMVGPESGSEDGGHHDAPRHHLFREILPCLSSNFLDSGPKGLWGSYSKF